MTPEQLEQLLEQARRQQGLTPSQAGEEPEIDSTNQRSRSAASSGPLLDRPISRTEYELGPGDLLTLSIFGYRNQVFSLTVTPEGTVVIPTIGVVPVGGLNLDDAARRARRQVLRFYPDSDVELSLASIRSFNIFVVGDVLNPGIRAATAVTRVSEVVPAVSENGVFYRNILVRRGGERLRVDLANFLQTGDLAHNPVVREGDIVQVPTVDETVTIAGEVAYSGTYEYRPAETLSDLIRLGNGGGRFLSKAADTILLMRFKDNPRGEIHSISRHDADGILGSQMLLEPFDAVYVPRRARYKQQTSATIEGEVVRPGRYPIRPNETTIRDLVEMAGGFTQDASLAEAVLRREAQRLPESTRQPLATIPPELLTRDEQRILQVTSSSDEENVIIDISASSQAYDLPVDPGDVIFVPKRRDEIVVMGAVAKPGLVVYTPGQPIEHFVEKAGGYIRRADVGDVVVLRTRSGTQLHRKDLQSIEPGDRIIVPFRERTTFLERVQTTQGVINTISGLVLTIVGLERLWDAIVN